MPNTEKYVTKEYIKGKAQGQPIYIRIKSCYKQHSLTIIAAILTIEFWTIGYFVNEVRLSDFFLNIGHAMLSIAGIGVLSLRFREVAKPED